MGWMFIERPANIRRYFEQEFAFTHENGTRQRVLDFAIVKLTTAYSAIEHVDPDGAHRVFAAVILFRYTRCGRFNFGYKDMDETMGPCEARCPERILRLLTDPHDATAAEWRERCRAWHERARILPRLVPDCTIRTHTPIRFADGRYRDEFRVVDARRSRYEDALTGLSLRIDRAALTRAGFDRVD